MVARGRSLIAVVVTGALLASCGEPGAESVSDVDAPGSSLTGLSAPPTPGSAATVPQPSGDSVATTDADEVEDGDAVPASFERCSDVAQATTDVISDPAQGNIDPIFHGVLLTYAAEHADTYGGLWLDRDAFGTIVLAFTDDPQVHREALAGRRPSADDVHAVDPPPAITDDRPIGEWGVAFDVVQVAHTETELTDAIGPVIETAQTVTGAPVSGGVDVLRNRVSLFLSTPVESGDLDAIADVVAALDGIGMDMVCWSGQFTDEAPDPIEPGTPLDSIRLPGDDGTYPPDTPVTCNGIQFELGDLEALTPADAVEPGLRSVLEDWLANPEGQHWPQVGWVLLNADDERATFIHISGDGVSSVGAEMGTNGWIWAGAGGAGTCDVRLMLPDGVGDVEWTLDPDAAAPEPTATDILLLATERGCASGEEMGDRLLGPQVIETSDSVLIAFGVIPTPGGGTCPGNPSTPVVVTLDAPLGSREIRDGMSIGPITSLLPSP